MKANHDSGFTLWELLTTLLVVGVLLGIGVPNVMEFARNGAMTAAANRLITGLLAARAEAVKRQVTVVLCASTNPTAVSPTCAPNGAGANGGFIVWADDTGTTDANGVPLTVGTDGNATVDAGEEILMQVAKPGGSITVWADSGYIAYGPNGFRRDLPAAGLPSANWLMLCDDRGNRVAGGGLSAARDIHIDMVGHGAVQQEVADVANALAQIKMSAVGAAATCP